MFSLLITGCAVGDTADVDTNIHMIVTKDFGNQGIYNEEVKLDYEEESVLELTMKNLEVETAYGGGFVNAINGIKSEFTGLTKKKKTDWFYYVNGILSEIGSGDYYVKDGDNIIWDYHDWSIRTYMTSIIGAYPKLFINGHGDQIFPVEIYYTKDYEEEVKKLEEFINKESVNVEVKSELLNENNRENISNDNVHTILIGNYQYINEIKYIENLYDGGTTNGFFYDIKGDKIDIKNFRGDTVKSYDKGAAISSSLKNYGSSDTLWIITGNDNKMISKAINIMHQHPEKIKGMFSAIVTEKGVENLPRK